MRRRRPVTRGRRLVGVRENEEIFLSEVLGGSGEGQKAREGRARLLNILLTALARSYFKSILVPS